MGLEYLIKEALSMSSSNNYARKVNIKIVGVGGAGCNSIRRIHHFGLADYAHLIAVNTDRTQIENLGVGTRILIGEKITEGYGTGGKIEVGERCVVDPTATSILKKYLDGADMTFVLAGLGGGTGGGAGPHIAKLAKSLGSLVVSIVTMPFKNEGQGRWNNALIALEKFQSYSNTVIVLDNNALLKIVPNLPLENAFTIMDHLTSKIIKNIVETIALPSMINIDYADLRYIMRHGGTSTVLLGEGGVDNLNEVVTTTLNNPLMDIDYRGADGALIQITGGPTLTLGMVDKVVSGILDHLDNCTNVKWGARIIDSYDEKVEVTAILTGVHTPYVSEYGTVNKHVAIRSDLVYGIPLIQ